LVNQEIEKLLKVADESETIELKIFQNAVIKNLKAFQLSPTKANKNNLDASRDSLEQKKQEVDQKYFSTPENAPAFPSLRAVVKHLTDAGFKVSKSKISRDKTKNLIRVNPDGTVLESEVRAYTGGLERKSGSIVDLNDVHSRKADKEIEKLDEQISKYRFEREKEQGKYIPKKDFEFELAARAAIFDSGFRHAFNMRARSWIALVGGKPEKAADFLEDLNQMLDEQLTTYATTKVYQVMFTKEDE